MADQNQIIESDEREIDLIDLMTRFFSWCGKVFKLLAKKITYFLIRSFFFYLVGIVLVFVLTMLQSRLVSMYYYCEMVVQSKAVSSTEAVNLVNNWNYVSQMSDSLANNIRSINGTYVLDYNRDGVGDDFEVYRGSFSRDTAIVNHRLSDVFCVQAQIYNADNRVTLDEIKEELFKYLENDSWVISRNKIRQDEAKATIALIDREMIVLDSLKNSEYFDASEKYKMEKNGALMMVSEKDKHLYHNDMLSLLSRKQSVEHDLYPEAFKVIQDFNTPMVSVNNTTNNFKKNLILIMLLTTLVALLFDQRKNIKLLIEKSRKRD